MCCRSYGAVLLSNKKWIDSFAAALGGLDVLVFLGGIGEHSPEVRSKICGGLAFIGLEIDETQKYE
jgi:acetate kinase